MSEGDLPSSDAAGQRGRRTGMRLPGSREPAPSAGPFATRRICFSASARAKEGIVLSRLRSALRKALELLARPVRAAAGRGGFVVRPYRGYGSREEVFLIGRVFRQPTFRSRAPADSWRGLLLEAARRLLSWGVADAVLMARFGGAEQRITTDRDGYFRVRMQPAEPPPAERLWHEMGIELLQPIRIVTSGEIFLPPAHCRFVVISDIDDTITETGVANKLRMLWNLFMQGAQSRVAFPGMAALLQALHHGASGRAANPMLYVSRGPWSIYEILDEFFQLHRIPIGPILFLREWGLTVQSPLPRRAEDHKLELIRNMLALYRELPFVLIGDSGQRDPEIYAQIVREHPGCVLSIYIRNVSRDPARHRAIEALALEVVEAGSSLLLAADSLAMAEHAATEGLIAPAAPAEVVEEREAQAGEPDLKPTVEIGGASRRETRRAVQTGALEEALEQETGDETPPNVAVEAEEPKREPSLRQRG
jgi:phosphatidate phosphatase APP1